MIGSIIGGIASIVGSSQTARAQREANATNLRINQMNNEFNAREAEKAFQRESSYNDKIRAEDREYNSAEAQVERYRQAGLNPAMMMQGQSAGVAQSNGVSSSAASAASSAPQQGTVYDYSMLGQAIQGMLERKQRQQLITEEVNGLRIENQYKTQQILEQLSNMRADTFTKNARAKLDSTIESMQKNMMQSVIDDNIERAKYNQAMRAYQNMVNEKVPDDIASQIALRLAQTGYYRHQSHSDIRALVESLEKQLGLNLSDSVKNGIFGAISLIK